MEGLGINWQTLVAQLINFIILFALLTFLAYKPILKMMDQRSRKIKEGIEQAEHIKEHAAKAEEEVKKQLDAAKKHGQEIITLAMRTGEDLRQKAQQEAKQDAETLISRARTEIQHERDSAIGEIKKMFADLAIMAAEKVIRRSLDKKAHQELIDKVLEEGTPKRG